jgi:coproporphyrinogen III oxidase
VQIVKKLLEKHLSWPELSQAMGPAGALEYYLLSLEAIICNSQPQLAENLALHFDAFLEKSFGGPGVVRRSLADGKRIARTMSLLCHVWGEYIDSIAQKLGHTDKSSSRDFVEKQWTVVFESAGG